MKSQELPGYLDAININDVKPSGVIEGLIVMPEKIDANDGTGYYDQDAATTYKELVALGYQTNYYTDKKAAIYLNAADEINLVGFLVGFFIQGVGSAALWDGVKALVRLKASKRSNPKIKGKIYINSRSKNTDAWQEYVVEGTVDDAIRLIDKVKEQHKNDIDT